MARTNKLKVLLSVGSATLGEYILHTDPIEGGYRLTIARGDDVQTLDTCAMAMERACANNNIGYSQPTRLTLFDNVKDAGFDPAQTTKPVNTDCSALVRI